MFKYSVFRWLVAFAASIAVSGFAHSAEITYQPPYSQQTMNDPEKQNITFDGFGIEGEIIAGDFEKFDKLVEKHGYATNTVALASPGGDVVEAMKIGRLIRELRFSTWAPTRQHDYAQWTTEVRR